jgi:hypothetical protein
MNALRTNIQNLTALSAVIAFASCESHKQAKVNDQGTEIVKLRTPAKDTNDVSRQAIKTVSGTVVDINNGKDGYTAKLETTDKKTYFATISHTTLKDHSQYRSVKVGDKLEVTGDYWKLGNEDQITVRELK